MNSLPPTTYEQRSRFYEDVEQLLVPGFLSHQMRIGRQTICLRTLSPGDMFLLKARTDGSAPSWRVWTVATCIWMVDGRNLLTERQAVTDVAAIVRRLPVRVQEMMFHVALGLFRRTEEARKAIIPFCYEETSRHLWHSVGPSLNNLTGVPGADSLGSNLVQQVWTAFNAFEDQRETDDRMWEGFKLSASAMSPKGVQKLDDKDHQRKRQVRERREAERERYFYYRIGLLDEDGYRKGMDKDALGAVIWKPKSDDDLIAEYKAWVAGEHDEHDRIVLGVKKKLADAVENERREREEMVRTQQTPALSGDDQTMVAFTQEQVSALLARKGHRSGVSALPAQLYQRASYLHSKYLQNRQVPFSVGQEGQ